MKDILIDLISNALLGFDNMLADAQRVLSEPLTSWADVVNISIALKPFCYVVIGICLLIELAQVAAKVDIVKWEMGLKIAVKMVFARVCIDIAPTFLEACYMQGSSWINAAASSGGGSSLGLMVNGYVPDLVNSVNGLWNTIGLFVSAIVVVMAVKICGLLVYVMAFARAFEIYAYLAVSPLPCAFFPLGNGDGSGFSRITGKFFRNFAAVCLQGVMMILCIRIFGAVMSQALTQSIATAATTGTGAAAVTELMYFMLVGSIVLVMSVVKCGTWAKTILDAA